MRSTGHSHPVSIIGPVITGNAFFPIWYHIRGFAGPRELGWSDTLYSFLESDGSVQCNAPTWLSTVAFAQVMSCSRSSKYLGSSLGRVVSNFGSVRSPRIGIWKV